MFSFSKRLIYSISSKIKKIIPGSRGGESKLTIDFSKIKKSPFDIKSESSYNAYLSNGSLEIGLKKSNCIAWTDIPGDEYQDHIIEAKYRLDSSGGYSAAGIIFRIMDEDTYYLALVSTKGYFRIDAVKDNSPRTLIAWTEISGFDGSGVSMKIITYGTYLIFIINGRWLGEVNDDSIAFGRVGFAIASYEEKKDGAEYACKANLEKITIDTRINALEESFKKWTDESNINAEERLVLAETFAVMDEPVRALDQIIRAWKRRDEAISKVTISYTEVRTRKELLLASRLSFRLGQYKEAEEYINTLLDQKNDSPEGKAAYFEKIKILNELNKFPEIKKFVKKNTSKFVKNIDYYTILGRCYWELKDYKNSAEAWDKAFGLNRKNKNMTDNGVYAANAANAHEFNGNKEEALERYISAGKIFLNQDNLAELAALMPKLALLGEKNWEARALCGKWAFSNEDYDNSENEFIVSDKLRCRIKPRPKEDPAVCYLWGLIHFLKGKKKAAVKKLEKAVKLAPDYGLFKTKLEEIKSDNAQ